MMNPALSRGEALVALRLAMQQARVDACLIPSADPHLSEYLPEYWQIRKWLTGFTGSVGTVVVTQDFAGIWVDSRYWVQAQAELANSGVTLMKIGVATDPAHAAWLGEHVPQGGVRILCFQKQRRKTGVPVVAVEDVGDEVQARQRLQHGAREVGILLALFFRQVDRPAEIFLIFDEPDAHAVERQPVA